MQALSGGRRQPWPREASVDLNFLRSRFSGLSLMGRPDHGTFGSRMCVSKDARKNESSSLGSEGALQRQTFTHAPPAGAWQTAAPPSLCTEQAGESEGTCTVPQQPGQALCWLSWTCCSLGKQPRLSSALPRAVKEGSRSRHGPHCPLGGKLPGQPTVHCSG